MHWLSKMEASWGPFILYFPSYEVSFGEENIQAVPLPIYRQPAFPDECRQCKPIESLQGLPELHPSQKMLLELWTLSVLPCVPYVPISHTQKNTKPHTSLNRISVATSVKNKFRLLRTKAVEDSIIFHEMKSLLRVIF